MKSLPTILQFIFSLSLIGLYWVGGQDNSTLGQNLTSVANSSIEEVNITMNNESVTNPSMNESKSKPEADRVANNRNQYQLSQVPFDSRYDYCSCDLKAGFCDLNCCCDEDCNDEERVMFAYCESVKHSKQLDQYCFKEYPVYQNNTRRSILVKESSSSLFCVFNDNVKNIKTYPDRKSVTNVQEYRKIITSSASALTSTFSWSHSHEEEDEIFTSTHGKGFRYGDPIVATSITSRGVEINDIFRLPGSLLVSQGFCDTLRPILFLKDSSHSCVRDIKDYQHECISNQFLGASIYYENIYISKMGSSKPMEPETRTYYQIEYTSSEKQSVKLPTTTKTSTSTNKQSQTADTRNVQSKMVTLSIPNCMYLNECIAIHWPDKDSNLNATRLVQNTKLQAKICEGVVNVVNYTFYYDPKDGIDLIRLSFGFTELTENLPIKQTFNVNFKPNENYLVNKTFPSHEFSGNKGYIFGKPILFRNSSLSNNSSSEINHYKIPSLSQGNGQCTVNPIVQQTVRFGSNYRTGCMLNTSRFLVENKMCQSIQREIMDLLDGVNKDLTYVAMFGNPNISNPSDWIPILVDDEPQILQSDSVPRLTADERCPALVTGFSLDIYYALVGQESQSQAKIISAVKRFNKPVDFRLRCHSLLCRHKNNNFLIELSLTVNYIDLTFPIETKFAPPPIFRFQLPSDFFYPFLTNSFHNYNDRKIFISCVFISLIIHYLSNQHI